MKLVYLILLIGYGYITVLTPNLQALDSNGPKFLSLALLNLATFLFLFTRKELKYKPGWYFAFFKNGIGIAYTGLMIVSLLSFFKAINVLESILHFAKIFTTFSAAYLVSIILITDRRNIRYLCVAMTLLLMIDSLYVFAGVKDFIAGKVTDIDQIKSGYSNKNILASSIFVKLPFALWLMIFNRRWLRGIGMLGTFFAITATLFMSTRAFYLGTIALSVLLLLFFYIRFRQTREFVQIKTAGIYLVIVVSSFLVYSGTQGYFYKNKGSGYAVSIKERLATITDSGGGGGRIDIWKRAWIVFNGNPMLGVGVGNWKIAGLKEENKNSLESGDSSMVTIKAHNDFIEIATETGIFGGLLFISLFLLVGLTFIRTLIKRPDSEWLTLLFLPCFGLFCYSIDAFFNFPQDRPEIGALFALYLGMVVALTTLLADEFTSEVRKNGKAKQLIVQHFLLLPKFPFFSELVPKNINRYFKLPLLMVCGAMISISIYILTLNFKSLKLQYLVHTDVILGKLTHPASLFINEFPVIPDLNANITPIDVDKCRYLINEKRYDEAIKLLKKNKSNPFSEMIPEFISMAYRNQNKMDSALTYMRKAYVIRPLKFKNVSELCVILEKNGLANEVEIILDKYFAKNKYNKKAWLFAFDFLYRNSNFPKAIAVLDSAIHYFPADSSFVEKKKIMDRDAIILPFQQQYNTAYEAFKTRNYAEAVRIFTEILNNEPNHTEARRYRAFCLQCIQEYAKSNLDLNFLIPIQQPWTVQYNPYNLRGVNYWFLGNRENACKNFKIAAEMGDKEGMDNYAKLCK